ncbi:MAG: hypothetical protein ACRDGS_14700, partial [Chloroflexota bacterium]
WARTVTCPNPACGARMPLVRSFALSTKKGKETWVEPMIDQAARTVRFTVKSGSGTPPAPPKLGRGAHFRCLVCGNTAEEKHIKREAMAGRMGAQLMAVVAEGKGTRIYLPPTAEQEAIAAQAQPEWGPDAKMPNNPRWFSPPAFGMTTFADLFTPRQLVALTTFSDLVGEARARVLRDATGSASVPLVPVSAPNTQASQAEDVAGARVPKEDEDERDARAPSVDYTPQAESAAIVHGVREDGDERDARAPSAEHTPQAEDTARGWRLRRYIPHFDGGEIAQAVTFRLADSLPQAILDRWRDELARLPEGEAATERSRRIEAYLDAGHGACRLRD